MAKILVADDNSNIQKMVILALKDQGIEVVAVGNGEAAVRKIADIKPDLVLADIFMPVRNGYEVCKFVKDDSALSHIPVILLVGAFDPLDEQEASRVGADGVLKKPFVPPDPLISMVKASLARAGVALGVPGAASAAAPAAKKMPPPIVKIVPPLAPDGEEDHGTPVFPVSRPSPLTIATGAQPLAFGSLLETATPEAEAVFAISAKTQTAPDRDWGSSANTPEEEEPEEAAKTGSWRISSAIEDTAGDTPAGQTDWREAAFSGIGTGPTNGSGWAPSIEKNSLAISEEEAAELARKHEGNAMPGISASTAPQDWSKAIEAVLPSIPAAVDQAQLTEQSVAPVSHSSTNLPSVETSPAAAATLDDVAAEASAVQPEARPDVNSWMAGAINNSWDVDPLQASQLPTTWGLANGSSPAAADSLLTTPLSSEAGADSAASASSEAACEEQGQPPVEEPVATPSYPSVEELPALETLLSPETKEILQEETAQLVAEEKAEPVESAYSGAAQVSDSDPAVAPNMDEIVAKVLAKMNPEVLQAVTREILKPLIEAMVKDEIHKK